MVVPAKNDGRNMASTRLTNMSLRTLTTGASKPSMATRTISAPSGVSCEFKDYLEVAFSHIEMYVDHLEDVAVYKDLESKMNLIAKDTLENASRLESSPHAFVPQGRDIVKQLISGFGFRVTGSHVSTTNTKSVLVTSEDPNGVQFIVTAVDDLEPSTAVTDKVNYHHFDARNVKNFLNAHSNRQGIAVLGFAANDVERIQARYQRLHPRLIKDFRRYYTNDHMAKVLEVYAFYARDDSNEIDVRKKKADVGTVLRFIEHRDSNTGRLADGICSIVPGLKPLEATFDGTSQAAYCDHWVSNVFSRVDFLKILKDTLGFTPKVDFNAGVVAAGEAQIESTVTGNQSSLSTHDETIALRDQSQVYLPINNALSDVGHVSGFLREIGQGIQHIACRVQDLVGFVQRANDLRKITGEGFTFLNIPRSYYGVLSTNFLVTDLDVSEEIANDILSACEETKIMASDGAVDLALNREEIEERLSKGMAKRNQANFYEENRDCIVGTILRSRYTNLQSLLKDHVSKTDYIGIVKNQILVDVQGDDLLYQIFTCNILQNSAGEEAPFLEFIQRVCSRKLDANGEPMEIHPGCGGFGIRNFLTLFLSIEVSKAMVEVSEAKLAGDEKRQTYAQKQVDCFTSQLNDSNPILTEISDAMTLEGVCQRELEMAELRNNTEAIAYWKAAENAATERKAIASLELKECSARYEEMMKRIREADL